MTRTTWGEVELSAYLDGELDASTRDALETALKQDTDLQQRLKALEATVDWVRAVPMREVPKNYLLTPAMVKEKSPEKPRRRRGLLWMRVATSLTGLAFVITLGLNVLNTASPRTMTQAPPVPEKMVMMKYETEVEHAAPKATNEDAADADIPQTQKTLSAEEEMALAPAPPDEAPAERGENMEGIGGGAEPAEPEPAPMMQMNVEEEEAPEAQAMPYDEAAPSEVEAPEAEKIKPVTVITLTHIPLEQGRSPGESTLPEQFPPRWLSGMLGIVTLVLAAITFWLSRHA